MKGTGNIDSAVIWSAFAGALLGAAIVSWELVNWWIEEGQMSHYNSASAPIALAINHFIVGFIVFPLAGGLLAAGMVWAFRRNRAASEE